MLMLASGATASGAAPADDGAAAMASATTAMAKSTRRMTLLLLDACEASWPLAAGRWPLTATEASGRTVAPAEGSRNRHAAESCARWQGRPRADGLADK